MTVLTAGLVKQALGQIGDFSAAIQAKLINIPDDEQVAEDLIADLAMADPAIAPAAALAGAMIPAVVAAVAFIIKNNQSATFGAQLDPVIFGGTIQNPARGR